MNKILEAIFSISAVAGSLLISMTFSVGWILFMVSSTTGIVWAKRTKNYYVMSMNIAFSLTNSLGIYNYIISPYLITG